MDGPRAGRVKNISLNCMFGFCLMLDISRLFQIRKWESKTIGGGQQHDAALSADILTLFVFLDEIVYYLHFY